LRIFETYAYTDVYEFLYNAGNENFINVFIQGGRPIYGLLNKLFLTITTRIDQLAWLRLFGICGLLTSTFLFYWLLTHYLFSQQLSFLCSVFVLLSPSSNIIGLWTGTYQIGWALALALIGGHCMVSAIAKPDGLKRIIKILLAAVFGLISLLTYQPAFTAFIIAGLLEFLRRKNYNETIYFLTFYFSLYLIYYGLHLLILNISALQSLGRAGFALSPLDKISWFLEKPLTMVFKDNFIFYPLGWQMVVANIFGLITLVSLFFQNRHQKPKLILYHLFFITVFIFSSYIPNLITPENWASYRTLSTLFMVKWIVVFILVSDIQQFKYSTLITTGAFGFLLFCNALYNTNYGFITPQTTEYTIIHNEIQKLLPEIKKENKLIFVMPEVDFLEKKGIVRRVVSDEFGSLSTSRDWVPIPMVKQILKEEKLDSLADHLELTKVSIDKHESLKNSKNLPTIDVEKLYLRSN